jgi:hypothetical protein
MKHNTSTRIMIYRVISTVVKISGSLFVSKNHLKSIIWLKTDYFMEICKIVFCYDFYYMLLCRAHMCASFTAPCEFHNNKISYKILCYWDIKPSTNTFHGKNGNSALYVLFGRSEESTSTKYFAPKIVIKILIWV